MKIDRLRMTDQKRSRPPLPKRSVRTDAAFDVWLNRGLHQLFDDVANEPLPEELLKLIKDDERK